MSYTIKILHCLAAGCLRLGTPPGGGLKLLLPEGSLKLTPFLTGFAERVAWCLGTPIGAAWGVVFEIKIAKRFHLNLGLCPNPPPAKPKSSICSSLQRGNGP